MPRILVVAPNWIGDMLMAQPLLARLREKLPRATIEVLAPEWVAPVARRMAEVNEVISRPLTRDDIYIADEAFFTGTAAEVTPIRELDGRMIGGGKAGPVTKAIQKAFFDVVTGKDKKRRKWLTPVKKSK